MRAFETLTRTGRIRRLRLLALQALKQYDLPITRVRLLAAQTNILFRVDTPDAPLVLRICSPSWRTEDDLRREVTWLRFLANYPEVGAPVPLPDRRGEYVVQTSTPGVSGERRCLLTSWIPGVPLNNHLNPLNLERMGELFARIHLVSASFNPPPEDHPRRMEHYLARDEPRQLFDPASAAAFTPDTRQIFEQVNSRVLTAFQQLYAEPAGLRLIHNDLWHGNIHLYRGRLYPLDFEDTLWGYPVQDIAMAIQDLMDDVAPENFEALQAAFRDGYTRLAAWPESYPGQVDDFRAGRMLWVANFVADKEAQHLPDHVERISHIFSRYLATGFLRKE